MELKTLKDLPRLQLCSRKDEMIQDIVRDADAINTGILKQEAIKWIEECQKTLLKAEKSGLQGCAIEFNGKSWFVSEWLAIMDEKMHFFNIVKEDLNLIE